MLEGMTWWAYVQKASKGALNVHIADAIGITPSSVGRWTKGSKPDPAQAAAFARAYNRPVLEAFIAAGFLSSDEAGERPSAPPSLATLSDDDLLDEVRRRMTGGAQDAGNAEAEKTPPAPVVPIRPSDRAMLNMAAATDKDRQKLPED